MFAVILAMTAAIFAIVTACFGGIFIYLSKRNAEAELNAISKQIINLALKYSNLNKLVDNHTTQIADILMSCEVDDIDVPEEILDEESAEFLKQEIEARKKIDEGLNNIFTYDGTPNKKEGK